MPVTTGSLGRLPGCGIGLHRRRILLLLLGCQCAMEDATRAAKLVEVLARPDLLAAIHRMQRGS